MFLLYLALFFVIMGYLGTALIAWQSIRKRNRITYAALVFIFLGAAGAVWLAIDTSRTSDEITGLNRKIAEKSDEIAKLNREIANSVTGGNSFCYMVTMLKQGIPHFVVVHQGKYPLYDLTVTIVDLDIFEELSREKVTLENLFKSEVIVNVGNVAPNQARFLKQVRFKPKETVRFNIFFSARNGYFTQTLRIKKVGTEWKTAFKVTQVMEGKEETLLEKIDDGYPRNANGIVQW